MKNSLEDQWHHTYGLYANDSPEGCLSNGGSEIAELILRVEVINFEKVDFCSKMYENSLEDL